MSEILQFQIAISLDSLKIEILQNKISVITSISKSINGLIQRKIALLLQILRTFSICKKPESAANSPHYLC